jgi:hypothetical protein
VTTVLELVLLFGGVLVIGLLISRVLFAPRDGVDRHR